MPHPNMTRVCAAVLLLCFGAIGSSRAVDTPSETETPEAKAHREKVEQLEREIALLNKQADLLKAQSSVASAIQAQKKADADIAATGATADAAAAAAVKKAEQEVLTQQLANAKTKAELQASVLDNIGKIGVPDLKGSAAQVPTFKLPATALAQIHAGADDLAVLIGRQIRGAHSGLPVGQCVKGRPLIMAEAGIRSTLMAHRATSTGLTLLTADLKSRIKALEARMEWVAEAAAGLEELGQLLDAPKIQKPLWAAPTFGLIEGLKLASVLTESAVHLAAATKRVYGADTVDGKAGVDQWFQARVLQELALPALNPQATLTAGLDNQSSSQLLRSFSEAVAAVDALRGAVSEMDAAVAAGRLVLLPRKGEKASSTTKREAVLKLVNELDAAAKEAAKFADVAALRLEGLWATHPEQPMPMDVALRGEALLAATKDNCALLLEVAVSAAQVDMVGSDSLFGGVRMAAGGAFSAHWRLTTPDGVVLGNGAASLPREFRPVAAAAFKRPSAEPDGAPGFATRDPD